MEKHKTPDWWYKFADLEKEASESAAHFGNLDAFHIHEKFSEDTINYFINSGTEVHFEKSLTGEGLLRLAKNRIIIEIKEDIDAFNRDCTLFHELVHACFISTGFAISKSELEYFKLEALVEFNARKIRAQSQLLRYAVKSFKLKPEVYDLASYRAFPDYPQQLFPFMPSVYEKIGTKME